MENFVYSVPTTVYFGKGQVRHIANIVSTYGKSVLLVYGGGSIKRNGIYDAVTDIFQANGISYHEMCIRDRTKDVLVVKLVDGVQSDAVNVDPNK